MQSLTPKTLAELAQALSAATEKAKIIEAVQLAVKYMDGEATK